jgi:tetratricopeptide (TPR) repeat protein
VLAGARDPSSGEPFVGPPSDFVCHAWRYCFADLVAALAAEDERRASAGVRYYWNDIFVEDQNSAGTQPDGYFFSAFRLAVAAIGRTVLVLQPLHAAIPLSRSWCIWEIFCTVSSRTGCELVVALPPSQKAEFERVLLGAGGVDELTSYVVAVDARNGKAFNQCDKEEIDRTIVRELGAEGFSTVNGAICAGLRAWLQQAAMELATGGGAGESDPLITKAAKWALAASLLSRQGKLAEAEPLHRQALEARERTLGPDHTDTLTSVNNLAVLLKTQGKLAEAEPLSRRALEARERTLGADHADTLMSASNLASLLQAQSKLAEAEPLHRRALEARERTLGADHAHTLTSVGILASFFQAQGKFAEAEPLSRRALEAFERTLGADHAHTLTSVGILAGLLQAQGKLAEAEPLHRRALQARERTLGADHTNTLASVNNLAMMLKDEGKFAEAEPLSRRALEARERTLGPDHADTLSSVSNLALLLQAQGKLAEAEPLCRRALEAQERTLGADHANTLNASGNLGLLLLKSSESERVGRELVAKALASLRSPPHSLPEGHPWIKKFSGALE